MQPPDRLLCTFVLAILAPLLCSIRSNDEGLLRGLFLFRDVACHRQVVKLRCPPTTVLRVVFAEFGRTEPSWRRCPFSPIFWQSSDSGVPEQHDESINCRAKNSMKVVKKRCEERRSCRVVATVEQFGEDPCPGTSKYLKLAYKCQPTQFRSRVTCESGRMRLGCARSKRIFIHSAFFGVSPSSTTPCRTDKHFGKECYSACSLSFVSSSCHDRRNCSVAATVAQFGEPCQPATHKFLRTIYACVPKRILDKPDAGWADRKSCRPPRDQQDASGPTTEGWPDLSTSQVKPSSTENSTHVVSESARRARALPVSFVRELLHVLTFLSTRRQTAVLYGLVFALSALCASLLVLVFVQRRRLRRLRLVVARECPNDSGQTGNRSSPHLTTSSQLRTEEFTLLDDTRTSSDSEQFATSMTVSQASVFRRDVHVPRRSPFTNDFRHDGVNRSLLQYYG